MEKIKFFVYLSIGLIFVILVYSLSKSWFFFQDFSVKINEVKPSKNGIETKIPEKPYNNLAENSKILWKNYLFYPSELVREAGGFGPEDVMNHAKNLTFVNLQSGKIKNVFKKNVYILDYFSGEFAKKNMKHPENPKESLEIENRLIIFAMTEDTNKDGFLNQKDLIKVFIYNPYEEKLYTVLPDKYYFQKLVLNSRKNLLVMVIQKLEIKNEKIINHPSVVYTYDTSRNYGTLIKEE